jgi:integrase
MSALESRPLVKTTTPGVYRRGNRYVVVYRDSLGKQRKEAAPTLAAARRIKREREQERERGEETTTRARTPFDQYAAEWIATYRGRTGRGIREETRREYQRDLELYAIPYFRKTRLDRITPVHVEAFVRWLATEAPPPVAGRRTSPGLSVASVRNAYAPVRAMFAQASVRGDIARNPCSGVIVPSVDPDQLPQVKALTFEQEAALVAAVPDRWRVLVRFMLATGLRISEAVALDVGSIDWDRRRVRVRDRMRNGERGPTKSRKAVREVPLGQRLVAELRGHCDGLASQAPDAPLWQSLPGVRMNPGNIFKRVLKPAGRSVGLDWVGWHTLRHTAATRWIAGGRDPVIVSALLGHSSPLFTMARYVTVLDENLPDGDLLEGA